jgi:ABC-type molybdate transport system permease subunit
MFSITVCYAAYCNVKVNLIIVSVKSTVFWVVTPSSSETARRFGGTYCLHLQDRRLRKARNRVFSTRGSLILPPVSAGFILVLLFDPEDGGDKFF